MEIIDGNNLGLDEITTCVHVYIILCCRERGFVCVFAHNKADDNTVYRLGSFRTDYIVLKPFIDGKVSNETRMAVSIAFGIASPS